MGGVDGTRRSDRESDETSENQPPNAAAASTGFGSLDGPQSSPAAEDGEASPLAVALRDATDEEILELLHERRELRARLVDDEERPPSILVEDERRRLQ